MKKFSERIGKVQTRSVVQKEEVDESLKNSLWNALLLTVLHELNTHDTWYYINSTLTRYCEKLWMSFFKYKMDEFPDRGDYMLKKIKEFYFRCEWYEIYDFLEFTIHNYTLEDDETDNNVEELIRLANVFLQRELSAYRIVNYRITEITSKEEIESIEDSLKIDDRFVTVRSHLNSALELMSNRKNPNYRNSIKESVCAVESLCSIITSNPKATLGQALNEIEKKGKLHPALKSAFSSLYGYTSDADGIRHKLHEVDKLKQEDAKFMLVACSAFINYLIQKESNPPENTVNNDHAS